MLAPYKFLFGAARSLHGKFFIVIALLVLAIGGVAFFLQLRTSQHYILAMTQVLNKSLAANLVAKYIGPDAESVDQLTAKFNQIMEVNPNIELYLVDKIGRIERYAPSADQLRRSRIDLTPVHDFISHQFIAPTVGDDPKDPTRQKVFSAALLNPEQPDLGFLYVILGGADYDAAERMVQSNQLLGGTSVIIAAAMTIALAAAFFVLTTMTTRLRQLAAAIDTFRAGGFRDVVPVPKGIVATGDELDRLAAAYNLMMLHIRQQMGHIAESNASRRDLVAGVSHDLRTPLALIKGYIETLIMKNAVLSTEDRLSYLEIALRQSDLMARLVEDLFELAKLEAPEVRLERERFQLSELVQDVVLKFKFIAEAKNVVLQGRFLPQAPPVFADIQMIERLLDNLIDNAIRHTQGGGRIEVGMTIRGTRMRIEISDTGEGIPQQDIPYVFDRFYRGSGVGQSPSAGAGLGLAIAKRIVGLHSGEIFLASKLGIGTSIFFELPLEA